MKLSDVRLDMRLRSTLDGHHNQVIVTGLIANGFIARIPDDEEVISLHWSMPILREWHEHYAVNGEVLFEVVGGAD